MQRIIPASRVARQQKQHLLIWNIIPLLGSIVAIALALKNSVALIEVLVAVAMWLLTAGLGISVGFHRCFTHRAFEAKNWLRVVMAVAGSMAAQGPVVYWVSLHRRHHECTDAEGDPHSPQATSTSYWGKLRGFWHGHMGWVVKPHNVPSPKYYARDLLKDRSLMFVNKHYHWWAISGIILPGLIVALLESSMTGFLQGVLWGGFVRITIQNQLIWSVNSVCHKIGNREYETPDSSRNNFWIAMLTFGEGWHNNHHVFPIRQGWV